MKKLIYSLLASVFVLTACFEDEGNYDYVETNPPHWLVDYTQPTYFVGYQNGNITLDGSSFFTWDTDSLKRSEEVRYEWIINGKSVAEGIKVTLNTEELMEKAGIEEYSGSMGTYGSFNVVEKSTGVKYMAKIMLWCYPKYSGGNWIILADKDNNAKLSAIRDFSEIENGAVVTKYEIIQDAYEEANNGESIPGKPLGMNWALDRHIGQNGSITVITDQGGYELNAEDLSFYAKIDAEQFLNGTPANFELMARVDHDGTDLYQPATFLASSDGQIYTRVMSKNYLGGKYLSEPYYIDDKGYKVSMFGNALFNGMIPCYDEKNRRILIATVNLQEVSVGDDKLLISQPKVVALSGSPQYGAPVGQFPEGTEMLYIGLNKFTTMNGQMVFVCLYNEPGKVGTQLRHFAVYTTGLKINEEAFQFLFTDFEMPERLDASNHIVSSGSNRVPQTAQLAARSIFCSMGTDVYCIQYAASYLSGYRKIKMALNDVTSPVTYMTIAFYNCDQLFVGCENGDVLIYDINSYDMPILLFKGNVGGKVLKVRQLGAQSTQNDKFNV